MPRFTAILARLRRRPPERDRHGPLALAERVLLQRGSDRASLAWAATTILALSPDPKLRTVALFALPATADQPETCQ